MSQNPWEQRPKTALDLACGTGSTTIPLARRGLKMSGLDLSSPMLQIAEEKKQKKSWRLHLISLPKYAFHGFFGIL